ncbi:hypothetical protein BV502_12770 [Leucobacter sp. OAMLP11]|nr:hypothetical protein BV502_12770 [Leucobacter sp. OAMLP11]
MIEAGLIEFGLFGYHGASTAGIAARAEVPQPHVYASFPSKGALFLAVVRRVAERLAEPTAERAAGRLAARAAEPIAERTAEHAVGRLAEPNVSGAGPENPAGTRGGLPARVPAEPAAEAPAAAADTPAAAATADAPAAVGSVVRAHGASGRSTESDGADAARVLLQAIALTADAQLGPELRVELSTLRTRIGASAFDRLVLRGAELLLARPEA